jgi:ABC-2 type transport system ATP-binding protein
MDVSRGTGVARARHEDMTAPAIEARGLGKDFGSIRALDRLDLEVRDGEFFGCLGPNGAGKTTTVHLLATLLAPTRGTARVAGHDVRDDGLAVRRGIGLVFQETTLDRDLTVEENLRFAARLWNLPPRVAEPRIAALLRQFGLDRRGRDAVRTLSGGLRRALDIARGMLHEPRVLFLDEPTAGLDPRARRSLWELIGGLRAASGLTVFLTTHYVQEAEPCDRVAVLDQGRFAALGTPADLKREASVESLEDVFLARTGRRLAGAVAE